MSAPARVNRRKDVSSKKHALLAPAAPPPSPAVEAAAQAARPFGQLTEAEAASRGNAAQPPHPPSPSLQSALSQPTSRRRRRRTSTPKKREREAEDDRQAALAKFERATPAPGQAKKKRDETATKSHGEEFTTVSVAAPPLQPRRSARAVMPTAKAKEKHSPGLFGNAVRATKYAVVAPSPARVTLPRPVFDEGSFFDLPAAAAAVPSPLSLIEEMAASVEKRGRAMAQCEEGEATLNRQMDRGLAGLDELVEKQLLTAIGPAGWLN